MITLQRSLKSIAVQWLDILLKIKGFLIGIIAIGLGVLTGQLVSLPYETVELIISILVIFIVMLIIINKPLAGVLIWLIFMHFIDDRINIPMGAGIPDLEFSRFIIAFLAIFMLARAAIGQFHFARPGLTEVWIIATVIGIGISAFLAINPKGVLQTTLTMYFGPLVSYFFIKNLVRNKNELHSLLLAIVIFGFVAALYGIYEQTTGNILFLATGESASEFSRGYSENLRQIRGLLGRSSNFARVLGASIPITFYLFFESKTIAWKILLVGMLLPVQAYGMFLTYNRTAWYSLIISLTLIQFFYPQFRKVYFVIVFVTVVGLWATWDQVNDSAVVNERINSKVSTLEGREGRWQTGLNMWRAKPVRGWGFDRYLGESGRFRTDGERKNYTAIENDYLHIMIGSGLIGFLPYMLFLLTPLVNSLRLFFKARAPDWSGFVTPQIIAIYWAIILAFAIGSYTQIQTQAVVRMIPFSVAGAVIGTHEHWLRGSTTKKRTAKRKTFNLRPTTVAVENRG